MKHAIIRDQNALGKILDLIKKRPIITIIIIVGISFVGFLAYQHFVFGSTWASWTGFGVYQIIKIDPISNQPTEIQAQTRTLWDWLQLLIIPVVLAIAALLFNTSQRKNELKIAEKRAQTDQEIATDRNREQLLQSYIDRMTELLLEKGLRKSSPEDEVRDIARTRTLTALRSLDADRKGLLIHFWYEGSLITGDECIVNLVTADLSEANVVEADLRGANLSGANLSRANLREANLSGANLIEADLSRANLRGAMLTGANLRLAVLTETDLTEAYLSKADLREAFLSGVKLSEALLDEAKLRGANLSSTDLSKTDLRDADLGWSNLSRAKLSGADLSGAILSRATLSGADLSGAKLSGADLSGADLSGAIVDPEQLTKAKTLEGATLPDGSKHE